MLAILTNFMERHFPKRQFGPQLFVCMPFGCHLGTQCAAGRSSSGNGRSKWRNADRIVHAGGHHSVARNARCGGRSRTCCRVQGVGAHQGASALELVDFAHVLIKSCGFLDQRAPVARLHGPDPRVSVRGRAVRAPPSQLITGSCLCLILPCLILPCLTCRWRNACRA